MTVYFATCPAYQHRDDFEKVEGVPMWSGAEPVPALRERVQVGINRMGPGYVVGYFEEAGWLGVMVKLDHVPDYLRRQRREGDEDPEGPVHIFGAELDPLMVG